MHTLLCKQFMFYTNTVKHRAFDIDSSMVKVPQNQILQDGLILV